MSYKIIPIPAFQDNYIWMIIHPNQPLATVVDPGDASVVDQALQEHNLKLNAILITHHHWDHTDGARELRQHYDAPIYGPQHDSLADIDHILNDTQQITLNQMELTFEVLAIPGHTLSHIAFYGQGWLFCGDTLFSAGCGRLFEGTPEQMLGSLNRLSNLPKETQVYCGHEYTLQNLKFALTVLPKDVPTKQKLAQVKTLRANDKPSLPSTIGEELTFNPFLRCNQVEIKNAVTGFSKKSLANQTEIFATLREWKDNWS